MFIHKPSSLAPSYATVINCANFVQTKPYFKAIMDNKNAEMEPQMPKRTLAHIKNKQRRQELFRKMQIDKRKEKLKEKKKKKREEEKAGDKAPPKKVPKTIENMRVFDETMVDPEDQEVTYDEATDEMAPYFNRETVPKVLITTSDKAAWTTRRLCKELSSCIPNSEVHHRRHLPLKRIIKKAQEKDFTDLIVINNDRGKANGMVVSHFPEGPTCHFKVSNVKLRQDIKRCGKTTDHQPELILNNFNTRLGHTVGRQIAALFPHDPNFVGRRVVTFHNQRDFIFFRHHRYVFKDNKKVGLQELGPRFTLKLRSVQKGTFDSKFGEYEWVHKRHEMDTSRRKFHL